MNLIEALKQANGKPVRRSRSKLALIVGTCNSLCWFKPTGDSTIAYGMYCDDLLADDWYVVEPKSKIEEAIERELESWYGCSMKSITDGAGTIPPMIRRIVNIALDEAKKCNKQTFCEICEKQFAERIDALKAKE